MITNRLNLPQPFVDAVTSSHTYKPNRYSVTEVIGGTCEAVLKRRHHGESTEDVADRLWAIFGTAVHKVLQESPAQEGQEREKWLCVPIDNDGEKYELSGIFDLYDKSTQTVTDWKVTSVWTVQFADFESWRKQTLIYCWMLKQAGEEARRGEIVAMLRDHSMRKASLDSDYPQSPVFKVSWDFDDNDFAEAEKLVSDWFIEVKFQEKLPDDRLAPCDEKSRWHKPDKWAIMKDGRKRAVRVFDDEADAVELLNRLEETDRGHHIEFRRGEDTKCESYCPVSDFCPQMIQER